MQIEPVVLASLPTLGLPTDADTVNGVTTHLTRLATMAELVMAIPLPDELESPSVFKA